MPNLLFERPFLAMDCKALEWNKMKVGLIGRVCVCFAYSAASGYPDSQKESAGTSGFGRLALLPRVQL
jgi:hypothetical protein